MTSSRRPPTFMPTIPAVHPGITPLSGKDMGWLPRSHEASNCFPVDHATPTYWTDTVSLVVTAGPVPTIRSMLSSPVGGVPGGTVTVGLAVRVPAGDGSWTGVIATGGVVDDADGAAVVAVVAGDDEELLHPANPRVPTASAMTVTVRRWRMGQRSFREAGCRTPGPGGDVDRSGRQNGSRSRGSTVGRSPDAG